MKSGCLALLVCLSLGGAAMAQDGDLKVPDGVDLTIPDGVDLTSPGDNGADGVPAPGDQPVPAGDGMPELPPGAAAGESPLDRDFDAALEAYKADDYATAREKWRELSDAEHGASTHNLGLMTLRGQGGPRDLQGALILFTKAGEAGVGAALHALGVFHLRGIGVAKDRDEAFRYFDQAATYGYLPSRYNLAVEAFRTGRQDEGLAMLQAAADGGLTRAQYDLAVLIYTGKAGAPDPEAARALFERAADGGDPFAAYNLALMQLAGEGGPPDPMAARARLESAAGAGAVAAQVRLAHLLAAGAGGIERDREAALAWFMIAAALGDAHAKKNAERLAANLEEDERARARKRADAFRPTPILDK